MAQPLGMMSNARRRTGRALSLVLMVSVPLLSGYVLPPAKVLQRWVRDRLARPAVVLPALLPVSLRGNPGQLYLDRPGDHAAQVGGVLWALDPGASGRGNQAALWRAVDLYLARDVETAASELEAAGIDLQRGGYARDACSSDGVAHTLGARGEGERGSPQVWFARSPLHPCRLRLEGGDEVEMGPPGDTGWPTWFRLDGGVVLEVTGAPVPALLRPEWATVRVAPFAPAQPDPMGDWRRAFGDPGR